MPIEIHWDGTWGALVESLTALHDWPYIDAAFQSQGSITIKAIGPARWDWPVRPEALAEEHLLLEQLGLGSMDKPRSNPEVTKFVWQCRALSIHMGYALGWIASSLRNAQNKPFGWPCKAVPLRMDLGQSHLKHALCESRRDYEARDRVWQARFGRIVQAQIFSGLGADPAPIAQAYARLPSCLREAFSCEKFATCELHTFSPQCKRIGSVARAIADMQSSLFQSASP